MHACHPEPSSLQAYFFLKNPASVPCPLGLLAAGLGSGFAFVDAAPAPPALLLPILALEPFDMDPAAARALADGFRSSESPPAPVLVMLDARDASAAADVVPTDLRALVPALPFDRPVSVSDSPE